MNELNDDFLFASASWRSRDREVAAGDVAVGVIVLAVGDHLLERLPVTHEDLVAVLRQLLDRLTGPNDQRRDLLDEAFAFGSRESVDVRVRSALLAHCGDESGNDAHENAERAHDC